MSARVAYATAVHDGEVRVVGIVENEAGYQVVTGIPPYRTEPDAAARAEWENKRIGIGPAAAIIILSSVRRAELEAGEAGRS